MSWDKTRQRNIETHDDHKSHQILFTDHTETELWDPESSSLMYVLCSCGADWSWRILPDDDEDPE